MTRFLGNRAQRLAALVATGALAFGASGALATPTNVRVSTDLDAGYVSNYQMVTGNAYTDAALTECGRSHGRQNEPSVAMDPRNQSVIVGSANDYCATYNGGNDADGAPIPSGPIWLGYYRSQTGGTSWQGSLVPGYPGDTSTYGARAKVRTGSAGDPVLAWDTHGRLYIGAESSENNNGLPNANYGDVWVATFENPGGVDGATINDGKEFKRSVIVDKGAAAKGNQGNFPDKTAIEVDRTGGSCDGNVYFAWSRFNGLGGVNGIYFARSTDHGATWSSPVKLTETVKGVQFPDISVTHDGNVYVTYRQFETKNGHQVDSVNITGSADCGATFGKTRTVTEFTAMDLSDLRPSGARARDCGDAANACQSGYTFFRADTGPRSTSDQGANDHQIYIVYEAIVPDSQVDTGTSFGWVEPGVGGQSAIYFVKYDAATGSMTAPARITPSLTKGQQLLPDITVKNARMHAVWYDSRNDPNTDGNTFKTRPIGNDENGDIAAGFDVYYASGSATTATWDAATRVTSVTSNLQWEQFSGRTVPFGGDYIWIDAQGEDVYMVWTDGRDVLGGEDPRDTDSESGADVLQCRTETSPGVWSGDTCPRDGGLDQNIYGARIHYT